MLCASYYFYISNNHWLIILILISTQIDYVAALKIKKSTSEKVRKLWLATSLVSNLGILGVFKYTNFFIDTVEQVAAVCGVQLGWTTVNIMLPVGISFYTFQSMSYTIDVYRGDLEPEEKWYKFAFYVAYFPQLIAGPIVRARDFLPQIKARPEVTTESFAVALFKIHRGLLKKIVFADTIGIFIDPVFASPESYSSLYMWSAMFGFTLQIYFDFSGYSDIAIGCARLMGFSLPENFRNPYYALSFSDFWRRWHISLSTWLKDYLYIPLGGNRMASEFGVYRNLLITMILGGLWHGAAWTYVVWGFFHGLFLVIERALKLNQNDHDQLPALNRILRVSTIFILVSFLWLVFRAPTWEAASYMFLKLFEVPSADSLRVADYAIFLMVALTLLMHSLLDKVSVENVVLKIPLSAKAFGYACAWTMVLLFNSDKVKPFIYFQF